MKATKRKKIISLVQIALGAITLVIIAVLGFGLMNRKAEPTTTAVNEVKTEIASVQIDLNTVDIDKLIDTSVVDEALQ